MIKSNTGLYLDAAEVSNLRNILKYVLTRDNLAVWDYNIAIQTMGKLVIVSSEMGLLRRPVTEELSDMWNQLSKERPEDD